MRLWFRLLVVLYRNWRKQQACDWVVRVDVTRRRRPATFAGERGRPRPQSRMASAAVISTDDDDAAHFHRLMLDGFEADFLKRSLPLCGECPTASRYCIRQVHFPR